MAVNLHPEIDVALSIEAMQEIIAWHDERQLIDYVTCGTGAISTTPASFPMCSSPTSSAPLMPKR